MIITLCIYVCIEVAVCVFPYHCYSYTCTLFSNFRLVVEAILYGWKNELIQSVAPLEVYEKLKDKAFNAETQRINQIMNTSSISAY